MNERMREMVSAVVDGEASDFECRRVLESADEPQVRALLARHYAVRAVVRGETRELCPPDLTASILAALATESPAAATAPRWRIPVGGVAVAASVCMAAVLGLRYLAPAPSEGAVALPAVAVAGGGAPIAALGRPVALATSASGAAMPVGFGSQMPVAAGERQPVAVAPDQLAEQRLRLFMIDHAQNAALNANQGMLPYARVVSYEAP